MVKLGKFSGDILVVNVSKVWMTVNTTKNPSTLLSGILANASPLRRKILYQTLAVIHYPTTGQCDSPLLLDFARCLTCK